MKNFNGRSIGIAIALALHSWEMDFSIQLSGNHKA
jgi:hypothetical protein